MVFEGSREPLRCVEPPRPVPGPVCAGIHMSDVPSFPYADLWRRAGSGGLGCWSRE